MINIAICDDEHVITEQMQEIIMNYQKVRQEDFQLTIYHSGEKLLTARESYDIIFLDIYMAGIDGIETAKRLRRNDKTVEIIYLTSYAGLTREALSVHAFEYLEKPIKREVIIKQLDEVLERILHKKLIEDSKTKTIDFNAGKNSIRLFVDDIYYFERVDRKIKAVTKKGNFILYETIASLEEKLHTFDFVTPHQSFVVNINNMKDYVKDEIVMMNYDIIPVAQKRASDFKRIMREFLQKQLENN
ncbi:DNA-binding response regulator [Anaerocolumna cellulosilytica]|uniref:Stage 0 sporulation protein A homolog n=1 Tax=Anaerocolumna cellulosilytica TaxID=433286 RepID=A0A6S6R7L3_9FIRM|nr:LytTR family DNA-binding domain-containing protein [Anaerocolumna cellulosilytica]MBB5197441.1 DNA-binding LytR/AlgR family response regulator [Anaerocolumna cellulosilytica]BCJ95460.1 DNA-binding response regulator [Anaerocolumna cellulosilytica]